MLSDARDLPTSDTLSADVVIVGSGIAGADLATFLSGKGLRVLLLESGRKEFDHAIQSLNDIEFLAKRHRSIDADAGYHRYLPPEQRGVSRVRQLGGTSNVWTGKWKYLQRSDFDPRPWIPNSDWPVGFDAILPYYREAAAGYGFGDLEAEAERPEIARLRSELARHGLKFSSFYWEASPTRTAMRFADEFGRRENLRVVTGATVTRLDSEGRRVTAVECRSPEGARFTACGRAVVLAAGALETARLLLVSRDSCKRGLGNEHDNVGRFYTDHPKHHEGVLHPGKLTRAHARELQYAPKPRFCICFALDDETQRRERLLEHVVYLKPIYSGGLNPIGRLRSRLRGCRDENGTIEAYRVKFVTEQVPQRESRVTLSDEVDVLGVPRPRLDWRFTDLDRRSLATTLSLMTQRFAQAGLGRFDFANDPPNLENMTDAAHQMGTVRMAARPEDGVVDTDCRVFSTDNLFVAGSGAFPTGPSYSPTFTILALARRLGHHLLGTVAEMDPRLEAQV